jgi:hypothetical protein
MKLTNLIHAVGSQLKNFVSAEMFRIRPRARRRPASAMPGIETLERRDLMSVSSLWFSGSTLVVKSNNTATSAEVHRSGSSVVIDDLITHKSYSFASSLVGAVEFQGGSGSDRFVNNISSLRIQAYGNGGNDYLEGYDSADYFNGGAGDDTLVGYGGDDVMWGGSGNDSLRGMNGHDQLMGEAGNDRLEGGDGNDKVWGGIGNDVLLGGNGIDQLMGDDGDDRLNGGADQDSLWGGNGADVLIAIDNATSDFCQGDAGADIIWVDRNGASNDRLAGNTSTDKVQYVTGFANGADRTLNGDRIADPTVKSGHTQRQFANNPLFSAAGPSYSDIRQGALGDCYMLAAVSAIARDNPHALRQNIVDFDDGTYGVRVGNNFYREDNDLAVASSNSSTPAYAGLGRENSMWVAVYEKAWAHYRTGANTFASIEGGWGVEVNRAFGSTSAGERNIGSFGSAAAMAEEIANRWGGRQAVTIGILSGNGANLVTGHMYTVISVARDFTDRILTITLRNPWGVDGGGNNDGNNDGLVTVTPAQLFRYTGRLNWGRV